ncbi:sensor histidine kinase [Flindersiella endophytica]
MGKELGPRGTILEAAFATAIAVVVVTWATLSDDHLTWPDYGLLVVGSLVLIGYRRALWAVVLITSACVLVYFVRNGPDLVIVGPVLIGVYAAVAGKQRLLGLLAAAPFLIRSFVYNPVQQGLLQIGWFVAAGVMGEMAQARRAYLDEVEQRAIEAERTREETALRRAADERLRIARELHDSLTHSISVIKVQAGVAVHLARKRGEEAPAALLAIQEASADAMRELRATLEVLRAEDAPSASGLDRLDELVARAGSTGLPVSLEVDGRPPAAVSADVDRAAYRIVQEALTNITRHAGPATATVRLRYGEEDLLVQVEDDGQAVPGSEPVPGRGLLGMRERAVALGGALTAGPRAEGGFRVRAELPLARGSEEPASLEQPSEPLAGAS